MIVWGIWWQDAFWFSTGPRTRKAKNMAADPHVVIGTEKADEAVILEGTAEEIKDRGVWKQLAQIYNGKYGGDVEPLLMASQGCVFRVKPQIGIRHALAISRIVRLSGVQAARIWFALQTSLRLTLILVCIAN